MIPTNTLEELTKAEHDLQRSQVSLIREISKGNEKSRLHANTLQAMAAALVVVQGFIEGHADNKPKVSITASSAAVKVDPKGSVTAAAPKKRAK
jgi:hypothetical protein